MNHFKNLYQKIQNLSIDVAIGAASCSVLFYILTGQAIYIPSLISLSLVVWLIYTLDHLIDAKKIKIKAVIPRHRFHQENFNIILFAWIIIAVITSFIIIYYLYPLTIYLGCIGFLLVALHFSLVKLFGFKVSPFILKEFGIALIYTFGVSICALSTAFLGITSAILISLLQVFLLASINLIEFSLFEIVKDEKEKQTSLARALGEKNTKYFLYGLIILNFLISAYSLSSSPGLRFIMIEAIFLIMNSLLLLIIVKENYFKHQERYRMLGDAVFLLPALLLILS